MMTLANFLKSSARNVIKKIRDGDYDGAITNARSLLERISKTSKLH